MNKDSPVFVAGHRGLVGSAVLRALEARNFSRLVTRSRAELDLLSQAQVDTFSQRSAPSW